MKLVGANAGAKVTGLDELPGKSNYFIGNDPKKWRTNVPNYAEVKYTNVYPGVDLVYYGNQGQLEYDFVVQPGADPSLIALDVGVGLVPAQGGHPQGVPLRIAANGNLVVGTDDGEVIFHKPVVYQAATDNGLMAKDQGQRTKDKHFVEGKYVLKADRAAFDVARYDKTRPLVIDPVLAYSTYLGGSGRDVGGGIAVDASGNAYVTGYTGSSDFPTTPGAFQTHLRGGSNAFISKLNAAGSALVYSTYLGGSSSIGDYGQAIAVDASGNVYVTGSTASSDFPTTPGALQTTYGGGVTDAFVSKLNAAGSGLLYSTYLGGSGNEDQFGGDQFGEGSGGGITMDASGSAYITGATCSPDFPTTTGAFQTSLPGLCNAFVSKLNAAGSALLYSTYLGGEYLDEGHGIAVDASGNAYVTGYTDSLHFPTTPGALQTYEAGNSDAFVSKLNAAGSALVYSTYLGGGGRDVGFGIVLDGSGNAYVTGECYCAYGFPTTPGAFQTSDITGGQDAFVSKLNAAGSAMLYSTCLGGSDYDFGLGIAVDASGNAYVAGETFSLDFPTTPDAFQTGHPGGFYSAFVSKLNPPLSALLYSTYLGGNGDNWGYGIAVDASGNTYVIGLTDSSNFPTTPGALQTTFGGGEDAFVSKFSFAAGDTTPPVTTASLTGPKGDHGWYRGAVTVTLTATDPDDPVAATYDSVDGGPKQTYSAPFSITSDGVHHLSFYSVDAAGNQEKAHKLTLKIDATPPAISVTVQPAKLWPPNGNLVKVSVAGTITDTTSGVDASSVTFRVKDEYGSIQPSGSVTLGAGGSYSFTVSLQASRRGTDLDGRLYTVTVSAEDNAGNSASAASRVIVPHDQASISSFSPTSGPVGTNVVIAGESFTGATRVTFGGVQATSFTVDSYTQITVTVPSGAKTGQIGVTAPGGTAASSGTYTVTM